MDPSGPLEPGMQGGAGIAEGSTDTAPRVGSGRIPVPATPVTVNPMEAVARFDRRVRRKAQR